ncbi:MAG: hypothetical protein IPF92_07990 [Myxococcales bacterium]|nr:hypothetical protein [Myxococcales bacterium]MBL0193322.1 hypothetical protein [Myxococcales bacterium]
MTRRSRVGALACALGAALCAGYLAAASLAGPGASAARALAPPRTAAVARPPRAPAAPSRISDGATTPPVEAKASAGSREVVFLHGMGERPEEACSVLGAAVPDRHALLCPRGDVAFGRGYTWGGAVLSMTARVDRAEADYAVRHPGAIDASRPALLIAFSQGAYVAMQILSARPARVSAALFIGADIRPTRAALAAAGVRRVAFAAGRYDMTSEPMRRSARALEAAGVDARFFDLGPVGHTYVAPDPSTVPEIVAWLASAPTEGS